MRNQICSKGTCLTGKTATLEVEKIRYFILVTSRRFCVNVWCGLKGLRIVGSVFYQSTITGTSKCRLPHFTSSWTNCIYWIENRFTFIKMKLLPIIFAKLISHYKTFLVTDFQQLTTPSVCLLVHH